MQYAHKPLPRLGYPQAGHIDERVSNCEAAVMGIFDSRGALALGSSISRPFPSTAMGYPVILLLTPMSVDFSEAGRTTATEGAGVIHGAA